MNECIKNGYMVDKVGNMERWMGKLKDGWINGWVGLCMKRYMARWISGWMNIRWIDYS